MISYLFRNSDWSALFAFLSPNLLRVVSPLTLMELAATLKSNGRNLSQWETIREDLANNLPSKRISLSPQSLVPAATGQNKLSSKIQGESVLELFFYQLLARETWLIDLRSSAFTLAKSKSMLWQPKPYYYSPSPKFLLAVRDLYKGFYHQDQVLFHQALKDLDLYPARESIFAQFGTGDQTNVQFRLKTFQATFTQVFSACAESQTKIPKDFLALGFMLLALYEHLERLETPLNVRAAFVTAEGWCK